MPLPQRQEPQPDVPQPSRRPEIVPEPSRPDRGRRWALAAALAAVIAAVVLWQLQPQAGFGGGAGGGAITAVRTMMTDSGNIERTLRLTGTTQAERHITIKTPRLRGRRSRRGSSMGAASVGVKQGINVRSSSSVASQSTMSSLSQTGFVSTSSGAASGGGGVGGGSGGVASSRMSASTTRVSSGGGSSGGNISASASAGVTAMGDTGLGSTASGLSGGGGGPPAIGRSRRGDFIMSLQKLPEAGTWVEAGGIVAEFDNQYMQMRLDDYVASVTQYEGSHKKSESEIEVSREAHDHSIESAKAAVEKAKLDLRSIPVLSQIQAERTKLALEEAEAHYEQLLTEVSYKRVSEEAQLTNSELDLKEAQVELQRAQTNVEKLRVRAPISGMVVRMSVWRGGEFGLVKEGDELRSGHPFLQIVDTSSMVVDATINQVDVDSLRIGQRARVTFDAFSDLELPARVHSIGSVAKAKQFRREFITEVPVKLKLEKTVSRVIPDLTVSAEVILEEQEDVTMAPLGAIQRDEESGQTYVYVKTGRGFERRDVETGLRNNLWVAVRSGLRPGEEIAMEPPEAEPKGD